jgi:hypothetical protein
LRTSMASEGKIRISNSLETFNRWLNQSLIGDPYRTIIIYEINRE